MPEEIVNYQLISLTSGCSPVEEILQGFLLSECIRSLVICLLMNTPFPLLSLLPQWRESIMHVLKRIFPRLSNWVSRCLLSQLISGCVSLCMSFSRMKMLMMGYLSSSLFHPLSVIIFWKGSPCFTFVRKERMKKWIAASVCVCDVCDGDADDYQVKREGPLPLISMGYVCSVHPWIPFSSWDEWKEGEKWEHGWREKGAPFSHHPRKGPSLTVSSSQWEGRWQVMASLWVCCSLLSKASRYVGSYLSPDPWMRVLLLLRWIIPYRKDERKRPSSWCITYLTFLGKEGLKVWGLSPPFKCECFSFVKSLWSRRTTNSFLLVICSKAGDDTSTVSHGMSVS